MSNAFIPVLMGSNSDFPVMQSTLDALKSLGVTREVKVTSAYRTLAATHAFVSDAALQAKHGRLYVC